MAAAAHQWVMIPGDHTVPASSGATLAAMISPRRIGYNAAGLIARTTATRGRRSYGEGQCRDDPMSVFMIRVPDGNAGRAALLRRMLLAVAGKRRMKGSSAGGLTKEAETVMGPSCYCSLFLQMKRCFCDEFTCPLTA